MRIPMLTWCVAIVTHKGAEADAGHYIGFVKKRALHIPGASSGPALDEDDDRADSDASAFSDADEDGIPGGGPRRARPRALDEIGHEDEMAPLTLGRDVEARRDRRRSRASRRTAIDEPADERT